MRFRFSFLSGVAIPRFPVVKSGATFLVESFFLRQTVQMLTPTPDEHMVFLTGPKLRSLRVICRHAPTAPLERQSVVFVRTSAASVAQALIPIIEQGAELHVIAHSHPGAGASATHPSGTDTATLGKLQRAGSPAIGLIVTRDNHARFFTVNRPFRVVVTGSGVTKLSEHVFKLHENDQDEPTPSTRPAILYAIDSLLMERRRNWNFRRIHLAGFAPDDIDTINRNAGCPLCQPPSRS